MTIERGHLAAIANDAGRLIRAGLNPKLRPSRDADYNALVLRYDANPEFQAVVRAFAGAQGLSIIACDRLEGIVLAPTDDSPFRVRLADYMQLGAEARLVHGLIHLAIAATAYPTAAALEDGSRLASVSALQVSERLRRFIAEVKEGDGALDPPPQDAPELEPLWRLLERWRAADTTPDDRANPHTKHGAILKAFRWLEERGLADQVAEDTWRLRERYRLTLLATANEALEVLRPRLDPKRPPLGRVTANAAVSAGEG